MHRHGYKGRKFHREAGQRRALLRGLASSLIEHGSIETTLPKAKELRPYIEKLVTKAKKGDVHNRRLVIAQLNNTQSAHILFDEVAPKLTQRTSGYVRITRLGNRKGDNAQMARISFVEDVAEKATKDQNNQNDTQSKQKKDVPASTKQNVKKTMKGDA